MFVAQTYVARRARLQSQFATGLLLFLGNEESPMNYADNTFHFRQDSTFLYYMGVDQPGWAAVIDLDEGTTTAFADDATLDAIVWTGVLPSVADLASRGGITATKPPARSVTSSVPRGRRGARFTSCRRTGQPPAVPAARRASRRGEGLGQRAVYPRRGRDARREGRPGDCRDRAGR